MSPLLRAIFDVCCWHYLLIHLAQLPKGSINWRRSMSNVTSDIGKRTFYIANCFRHRGRSIQFNQLDFLLYPRQDTYLPRISSSSPTPLKCSVSYIKRRNMLFICLRIKARNPKNLPYIRCNTVFKKSRSLGSSESNSSSNYDENKPKRRMILQQMKDYLNSKILTWSTNFWSITFLPKVAWKSADSRKRRNTSYTSCRWGQDASSVGSSSSGSKSGFSLGGSVRNRFTDI